MASLSGFLSPREITSAFPVLLSAVKEINWPRVTEKRAGRNTCSGTPGTPVQRGLPVQRLGATCPHFCCDVFSFPLFQSPAPVTPKSVRCTQRDTFFKTPGSLGDPVLRKRERNPSRNTTSAQRRLEIPSGGSD